jgi:hypothetical protein
MRHGYSRGAILPRTILASTICLFIRAAMATEPAVPVCAILADPGLQARESSLASILEVKLPQSGAVRLVERSEIEQILREQALQLAFSPAGADIGGTWVTCSKPTSWCCYGRCRVRIATNVLS